MGSELAPTVGTPVVTDNGIEGNLLCKKGGGWWEIETATGTIKCRSGRFTIVSATTGSENGNIASKYPELWQSAARKGGLKVRGVLNLAGGSNKTYSTDVQRAIEQEGWATLHVPIAAGVAPSREQFSTCLEFVDNCTAGGSDGAVVVHCANGVHRTGAFCVRFAIERLGYLPDDALREFEFKRSSMRRRPKCREFALYGICSADGCLSRPSKVQNFTRDLTEMVLAFSTDDFDVPAGLFESVAEAAIPRLGLFLPSELAKLAKAFANAGAEAPELFEALAGEVTPRMNEFCPESLCELASAFAKARVSSPTLFEALSVAAVQQQPLFTNRMLQEIALSLAEVGVATPPDILELLPWHTRRKVITVNSRFPADEVRHRQRKALERFASNAGQKQKKFGGSGGGKRRR